MSNWAKMKALAVTRDDTPTLTDQSQARETDINVIVSKMGITGTVPGNPQQPMYVDWTAYPADLRGFLETARRIDELRKQLPKELHRQPIEELLQMTPEQVSKLLKPEAPAREEKPNG